MKRFIPKILPISLFFISIYFFVLGLIYPIMGSSLLLGLQRKDIFLFGSVEYFFEEGELFVGMIILTFTFIFPILKYIILFLKIIEVKLRSGKIIDIVIDIINKWAMLDVFVVALLIINMKLNSILLASKLKVGTTYFALSILLLMICSVYLKYQGKAAEKINK